MTDFSYVDGVYNITPTPFKADGSLDLESLARLTRFIVDKGVDGMTILGVLGETAKVLEPERDEIIATVLEAADGRIPICVGATHGGTYGTVERCRRAQELGAKAVMVSPPAMASSNQEAIKRHFRTIVDAIDIPVVMQDHPASSGVTMSEETIVTLAEESEQLAFLKLEDEPSPTKVGRVRKMHDSIVIFGGLGGVMFLEELRHGANGTMTGFAFPEILVQIQRKWRAGDGDGATKLFYHYAPLIRFENQKKINLALRKEIYRRRGAIESSNPRAPFSPVDDETLADLDDLMKRLEMG